MNFCAHCGQAVERRVPAGDDRERAVCPGCGTVHYENPRTVVGCLVEQAGGLLLCRRAIEPGHGLWTLPAGFLELGESLVEGARRETREEACADVTVDAPHSFLDLPHIGQSYALFRAHLAEGSGFAPGDESLETEVFALDSLPWLELAFPVIHFAMELYVQDRRRGDARVHTAVVHWEGQGSRFDARQYRLLEHMGVPLRP
jgi:ADP-ribose/FAD diphosphatase